LRALAVDDSVDAAESMAMLVKASGHEVRTAYDGPKLCERLTITDPM
jgi:two-component system OmpR family response regulator